ncbi:MAG: zinc-binding alcohol dehydrogenase family protein [Planctomycetes bacterium]|nr:zinc-binding alcohol dehydrogenase family protein [Planctomycetota bacterium]
MRAIGFTEHGGPEVLRFVEVPEPRPGPRDIVVRVHAAGVNPVDAKVRAGTRGGPLDGPRVPGWDASGVVVAAGPRCTWKPGDEVFFAGDIGRPGAYAERVAVDERLVGRKPRRLTHAEAAAMPLTTLTAWEAFVECMGAPFGAEPSPEPVRGTAALVVGGGGGVGSVAIQVASRVCGLDVVATASREDSRAFCERMGARAVLDHGKDLRAQTDALGLKGYDYILSTVDTRNLPALVDVLNPAGALCYIVPPHGPLDLSAFFPKRASLSFELMFARARHDAQPGRQGLILRRASELLDEGVLRTTLTQTLPWTEFAEAHRRIDGGHTIGKIVLEIAR